MGISPMCSMVKIAAVSFIGALGLAVVFQMQGLPAMAGIALISAALSVAQVFYWSYVCNGFRK